MKLRIALALLVLFSAAGCSSTPLPTIPWFSSSPQADPSAEALFEEGTHAFNEKKYLRALNSFSRIKTDYPFSPLMTQVELKIADTYYLDEQYPEAINAFKEFQSMHPTNENIPFVLLRLGQAHFDQFTATDRDQKNTEIAKNYFDQVVTNYPNSPQAAEARKKLVLALVYLAEHDFNIAQFYFQQQKFTAARDRFEEIVRKYKSTPTAVKSLFYLGECYRVEKNPAQAALAYEALLQHYPESEFAAKAKTQLAIVEQEKRDPLELVLRRDRRRGASAVPEVKEDPALAKLKDLHLIAKTEVVYEEPGAEKGFFSRVADKINPFSSSDAEKNKDNDRSEDKEPENGLDLIAKRQQAKKQESGGFFSSLWPFGTKETQSGSQASATNSAEVIGRVDASLNREGIDDAARQVADNPPPAELPKVEAKPVPLVDPETLLSSIDGNLQKTGKSASEVPPPPDSKATFREFAANQAAREKTAARSSLPKDSETSNILSSIDQKLKVQGVEPKEFDRPPTAEEIKAAAAQKPEVKNVEIEPTIEREKGPLFLAPKDVALQQQQSAPPMVIQDLRDPESSSSESAAKTIPERPHRVLVKGPVQQKSVASLANPAQQKSDSTSQSDDTSEGLGLDQLRKDMETVSDMLNPFKW